MKWDHLNHTSVHHRFVKFCMGMLIELRPMFGEIFTLGLTRPLKLGYFSKLQSHVLFYLFHRKGNKLCF